MLVAKNLRLRAPGATPTRTTEATFVSPCTAFSINMVGGNPDDEGIDARLRVYSGRPDGSTVKIEDVIGDGADDPITYNPRNPLNYPNLSKIKVSGVGIDDDGLAGAPTLEIKQPVIGDGVTP